MQLMLGTRTLSRVDLWQAAARPIAEHKVRLFCPHSVESSIVLTNWRPQQAKTVQALSMPLVAQEILSKLPRPFHQHQPYKMDIAAYSFTVC